ncbi:MAG: hypothetical protein ACFFD5_01015 [Candidatus Thorarchaeota archaeon]
MVSPGIGDTEPILNLKNLFYEIKLNENLKQRVDNIPKNSVSENLQLLKEIQAILKNCTHLNDKQKFLYCESQRYFMKMYLREVNRLE